MNTYYFTTSVVIALVLILTEFQFCPDNMSETYPSVCIPAYSTVQSFQAIRLSVEKKQHLTLITLSILVLHDKIVFVQWSLVFKANIDFS